MQQRIEIYHRRCCHSEVALAQLFRGVRSEQRINALNQRVEERSLRQGVAIQPDQRPFNNRATRSNCRKAMLKRGHARERKESVFFDQVLPEAGRGFIIRAQEQQRMGTVGENIHLPLLWPTAHIYQQGKVAVFQGITDATHKLWSPLALDADQAYGLVVDLLGPIALPIGTGANNIVIYMAFSQCLCQAICQNRFPGVGRSTYQNSR